MTTIVAIIALIMALVALFMAWMGALKNKNLVGQLERLTGRIETLNQEITAHQKKFEQQRAGLTAQIRRLTGESGNAAEPVSANTGAAEPEPFRVNEVTPQILKARLDNQDDLVIVDMRQPFEYHSGHIPGAVSMFLQEIPARLHELPQDKDVIFQCWSGNTSLQASAFLIENGWSPQRVFSLSGGIAGWTQTHGMESLVRE